uniref:Uncharacterized protein IAA99-ASL3-15A n=1 Tax=Anisakis simplex TaxID=6269 RepID=Q9U601_ANISI|nr:hypothetical protein [Anisakis simplex]
MRHELVPNSARGAVIGMKNSTVIVALLVVLLIAIISAENALDDIINTGIRHKRQIYNGYFPGYYGGYGGYGGYGYGYRRHIMASWEAECGEDRFVGELGLRSIV